jgi:hypothetical protein
MFGVGTSVPVCLSLFEWADEPVRGTVADPADRPVGGAQIRVVSATGLTPAEEPAGSAAIVDAGESGEIRARPLPTIGHLMEEGPGILLQQTSAAQVSPFLRGLTGYQVLNLIDGVRFNNSTFRSGPNQYLAFVESSQAQRIETALGPSSSQYGSWNVFGATADASGGTEARISVGTNRLALLAGASAVRHNDLRAGAGEDSRHVLRRFFGLSAAQAADLAGNRQQDTAFTQWAANTKVSIPRQSRGLSVVSRSKRLCGVADAAPRFCWPPRGGLLLPKLQLFQPFVFLLPAADVFADHPFVAPDCGHKQASCPEVLADKVPPPLSVHSGHMNGALAFDVADHLRYGALRGNRNHHVHVVAHQVPFLDPALLLPRQLVEHLAEVLPKLRVERLPAALRDEHDMIFAFPLRMA